MEIRSYYVLYRVTTINVTRKWIEWAEWAASLCTANSPFPGHIYGSHPVVSLSFILPFLLLVNYRANEKVTPSNKLDESVNP